MVVYGYRPNLAVLAAESVHVAGVHLRDPKSGDYNLAPVRGAIRKSRIRLINLARWEVGLATAAGSPVKSITSAILAAPIYES